MNLYYCTKRNVYQITKNGDGTVTFFPEEKNAGSMIAQRGGVTGFLAHCIEYERSYEEIKNNVDLVRKKQLEYIRKKQLESRTAMSLQNAARKAEAAKNDYIALLAKYGISPETPKEGGVIEATAENLTVIMRYLQTVNWGLWRLPKLSQGYSAHQYDCDGTTAVTIILDEGIVSDGKLYKKLQYGAPVGHLTQYATVGRL